MPTHPSGVEGEPKLQFVSILEYGGEMEYEDEIPLHSQILDTLCQAGMNRSSLVTCLVLMRDGWSAADAIALIRDKRSEYVLSNQHFLEYVENWVSP